MFEKDRKILIPTSFVILGRSAMTLFLYSSGDDPTQGLSQSQRILSVDCRKVSANCPFAIGSLGSWLCITRTRSSVVVTSKHSILVPENIACLGLEWKIAVKKVPEVLQALQVQDFSYVCNLIFSKIKLCKL